MTEKSSKTPWLVISYFSRIDGMACAQHIDDRIPFLRSLCVAPILLTGICGDKWPDLVHAQVSSCAPSGIRFELRHLQRRGRIGKVSARMLSLPVIPFYLIEKLLIDLDSQWSWFPFAIMRGISLCRKHHPEIIYSTGGPVSAHLAAAVVSRATGIPLIAEFQDPLVHADWLRSRRTLRLYAWLERFICKHASSVVFLTEKARENAKYRTAFGEKGQVIYPGANPADAVNSRYKKGNFCRFSHFGSLGGSRNLLVFLEALRLAFTDEPELSEVIRLDLYGSCDAHSRRSVEEFPWPHVVFDHGRISRVETLSAMRQTDVLLLIQNVEEFSAETIPSKVYEYLQAARPILGLVHKNVELREKLSVLGHQPVDAASPGEVLKGIKHMLQKWRTGNFVPCYSPFTVEAAVDKLVEISDNIRVGTSEENPHG